MLTITITQTAGQKEPPDVVAEGLAASMEGAIFEAGDEPSVYEVDWATVEDSE